MNTIEDRLRDAFRADADTVRPDTMRPFPGREGRPDGGSRRLARPASRLADV